MKAAERRIKELSARSSGEKGNYCQEGIMQVDNKTVNRVVLSSLVGATIEWYDFFLYGVLA